MKNTIFNILASLGLLSVSQVSVQCEESADSSKPNLILIMTDDQGYGDLGIHGNPVLDTPHMDQLARESATMETFYVAPVCSPTRAGLMTGRYHYRTRVVDTFKGRSMMEPEELTLAEILRNAGYATGIFGKWHLGDCYPQRPMDQGFEESLIHRGGGLGQPSEPIANARRYTNPILIHNGEEIATRGYCTDVYFDAAMHFMDQSTERRRPFFAYIAPNAPHGPFHDVPEALYQKYRQRDLSPALLGDEKSADKVARVFAMIENIDENVGRLSAQLNSRGISRDTLVVLMFDNGPNSRRYVGNMRGMKSEVYEGGIRSPFYMRWPARLKPGASSDRVAAYIDVLPTLLEAANLDVPGPIDGRSLLPLLEEKPVEWPDRDLVFQVHRGNAPVPRHHFAVRNQDWKLVRPSGFGREQPAGNIGFELYRMTDDPREEKDLSQSNPGRVQQLLAKYDAWLRNVSSTRPDNFAPPRIVLGTDHEIRTVLTRQDWRVSDEQGWGQKGRWLLDFKGRHDYRVEFHWPDPIAAGEIQLTVGSVRKSIPVQEAAASVVLESLEIPAGPTELHAVVSQGNKTTDPYHVVLIQK